MKCLFAPLLAGVLAASSAFAAPPERIISADGSLTEIVYALGEQRRLAGVDTTSGYPETARQLPQIGYKRNISAEGALSLSPDVLIATEDSGPDKVLNQITAAGVEMVRYSASPDLEAVKEKILGVAKRIEKPAEGEALWLQGEQAMKRAEQRVSVIDKPVRVLFVLSNRSGSPLVGGANTHADTIIRLAGGVNAAAELEGYKPMPTEAVAAAQPDVILMMSRGGNHKVDDSILDQPGFTMTPAAAERRIVMMDGMLMLGFGPRIGQAVEQLIDAFYGSNLVSKAE